MRDPQLCVTVTTPTMDELRRRRDAAAGADLVELRLDGVDRPDAAAALEGRLRPAIVTCRPRWEGGEFDGSEQERRQILLDAIAAGAEFVDLELRAEFTPELVRLRRGRGVIVSSHVYGPAPADLTEPIRALRSSGAEVIKYAYEAPSLSDTLRLFDGFALLLHRGVVLNLLVEAVRIRHARFPKDPAASPPKQPLRAWT